MMATRIKDKYAAPSYLAGTPKRCILTDTDPDFCKWAQNTVNELLDKNVLQLEDKNVIKCDTCSIGVALADAPVDNVCARCGQNRFSITEEKSLIATFTEDSEKRAADITHTQPRDMAGIQFLVNKRRFMGVGLEQIGLPGHVIDPKIGIGLLALYAAQSFNNTSVTVVAGLSSAHKNIPQLTAFLGSTSEELPKLAVRPIPRVPVAYLRHLIEMGTVTQDRVSELYVSQLPALALGMRRNITPETVDRVLFSKRTSILQKK